MKEYEICDSISSKIVAICPMYNKIKKGGKPPIVPPIIGTGFIIDEDGLVVTCKHVVESVLKLPKPENKNNNEIPIRVFRFVRVISNGKILIQSNVFKVLNIIDISNFSHKEENYPKEKPDICFLHIDASKLEKIELCEPHFIIEFVEDEFVYSKLTKTHIGCIETILDLYELNKEYEGEKIDYDEEKVEKIEVSLIPEGYICSYCGLPFDLFELFFGEDGPYISFSKKFDKSTTFQYIQSLCKELFGDVSTLNWAKNFRLKSKVRVAIKKIVILNGKSYHPKCAISMAKKENFWKDLTPNHKLEVNQNG